MDCFVSMLISLFLTQTSNLVKVAAMFISPAKSISSYRRVQRFLAQQHIDFDLVATFIWRLFQFERVHLILDRTNWKFGKANLNILMLSVAYKGISVPLMWSMLDKRGNSNYAERIALVERFVRIFGKNKIIHVLADREFVGHRWLQWLEQQQIGFCIRIKKNSKIPNSQGTLVQTHVLFQNLKLGKQVNHPRPVKIDGVRVYLSALKLPDGALLLVASDCEQADAIRSYGRRWEIETLFSCLKNRGFNLEDTHLTDQSKMSKLLAVCAIGFCWAYRVGAFQDERVKKIPVKNHGRRSKSLFRAGLDVILESFRQAIFLTK